MPGHDVIAIGASAGGVETLSDLLSRLPVDLPAAVLIVLHLSPTSPGTIGRILDRAGPLPVALATDGEPLLPGRVYVAPPDRHLLVERDRIVLTNGPRENLSRPAIDPLFRSVALAYGPRAIGVILSGALDDGTSGLAAIKGHGGVAMVQDPDDAIVKSMPASALSLVEVDYCAPIPELAQLITRIVAQPAQTAPRANTSELEREVAAAKLQAPDQAHLLSRQGDLSGFTCPQCGGSLWELRDGSIPRFRCHTGHAYSESALGAEQDDEVERALWAAVRVLQEQSRLFDRFATQAEVSQRGEMAQRYHERSAERWGSADAIRRLLRRGAAGEDVKPG